MAVTLKGQTAVYEGTSTDTKPTDADNNAIFKELDTGIRYYYDGTDWNEIPRSGGGGGGGTGTDDYTDLNNKPKVNNVTVVGNLTSSDLKLQGEITSSHKLSADLVDDSASTNKFNVQADWDQTTNSAPDYIKNKPTLGTAAATDATAYATAAQGTKADNAIQTVEVNGTALTPTSAKAVNITVPTQASDINALPNTTKYAAALSLTINSSTFVMTGQLKDQNGDNLGTAQPIDLPLESVVVGGRYDSQTKKVILTLQNGDTIEFSVADLVSGLQTELSASNKLNPAYINYDSTHRAVSDTEKSTWNGKQNALSFDGTYSASTNKVATVSTVTNAVNALDVTGDASVSASKTISAWSETDGKVSISTQDIAIAGTQTTLTGYAKSGTAGQAVAATDNVNQAIGKLEATVDDNKNNISSILDGTTIDSFGDVETALSGKQATLTTAQLAAVNSGITEDGVEQIETNKNNILSLTQYGGGINKFQVTATTTTVNGITFTVNADKTITATGSIVDSSQNAIFTMGAYTAVSGDVLSEGFTEANSKAYIYARGGSTSLTTTPYRAILADDIGVVRNYACVITAGTVGQVNITFKPMICNSDSYAKSGVYQPYAMSNAELTAAIQALQAQLANQ